jgi:hypothetical protein
MRRRRASFPLLLALAAIVAAAHAAGCAYDWTVGHAAASDAGADVDLVEAGAEGASEASSADGAPADATPGADGGASAEASAAEAAASCAQLEAEVRADRGPAVTCTPVVGACSASVSDECGCTVYVGDGTSSQTTTYKNAVSAFLGAGCRSTIACADTCPAAQANACAVADAAGSYVCY